MQTFQLKIKQAKKRDGLSCNLQQNPVLSQMSDYWIFTKWSEYGNQLRFGAGYRSRHASD